MGWTWQWGSSPNYWWNGPRPEFSFQPSAFCPQPFPFRLSSSAFRTSVSASCRAEAARRRVGFSLVSTLDLGLWTLDFLRALGSLLESIKSANRHRPERPPPGETRPELRRTTARPPELHRQRNALETERSHPTLETLPALQHDPGRPEDVLKVDADEEGVGGDDPADALRYLVATKSRSISQRKLRGL
jgi:hypothetical protein